MQKKNERGIYRLTKGTLNGSREVSVTMIVDEYIRRYNEPISLNVIYDRLNMGERDLEQLLVRKRTYVIGRKPKKTGLTFNQRRGNYYNEQGRLLFKTI